MKPLPPKLFEVVERVVNQWRSGHPGAALKALKEADAQNVEAHSQATNLQLARIQLLEAVGRRTDAERQLAELLGQTPPPIGALLYRTAQGLSRDGGTKGGSSNLAPASHTCRQLLELQPGHLGGIWLQQRLEAQKLKSADPEPQLPPSPPADKNDSGTGQDLHLSPALPKQLLLVLGMHRSGTSAIAGYLCNHGFQGPAHMPPPDHNNPTGYWEPQRIQQFHTSLLEDAQTSWDDPFMPEEIPDNTQIEPSLGALEEAIRWEFPPTLHHNAIPLIKEPRQCRLQPLWNRLLERHGLDAAVVLVSRHPLAVVQSLQRRERMPADRALLLWLQHTLDAERHTRHLQRCVIHYEDFLNDPEAARLQVQGLWPEHDFPPPVEPVARATLVRTELNNANLTEGADLRNSDPELLNLALEVHQALQRPAEEALPVLDQSYAELQRHLRTMSDQLGRMVTLQLFWQSEKTSGLSEDCSIRETLLVHRGAVEHTFTLPHLDSRVTALRLDPAEYPCLVRIEQLELRTSTGGMLWCWTAAKASEDSFQPVPLQPANSETTFIDLPGKAGVGVLSHGHDPALDLLIPLDVLNNVGTHSTLAIRATWELISSELGEVLANLNKIKAAIRSE